MASTVMTVVEGTKAGMLDLAGNGATLPGNTLAGVGYFQVPNDGKTVVILFMGAGAETYTFLPVLDKYGRTEALAPNPLVGDIAVLGPWLPELWNDANGYVNFQPAAGGAAADLLLAMRFSKPT